MAQPSSSSSDYQAFVAEHAKRWPEMGLETAAQVLKPVPRPVSVAEYRERLDMIRLAKASAEGVVTSPRN
jgi:hypothetical protein